MPALSVFDGRNAAMNSDGLLIVFTGNGKGKTTAALGMAMRAAGHAMSVLVLQFIKGAWSYGELAAAELLRGIEIKPLGTGFTWKKENLDEDRRLAAAGWELAAAEISGGDHAIVVLDELNVVLSYGLLPIEPVVQALRNRRPGLHVVVTGRNAPPELTEIADLVTEMREVKHPFRTRGLKAQKGIEF
ncbi:MAG: cob(I)yrinic acid a,c-diamide adenosyltransferase [Desulfobacteraceae bacterium]|nr:cob(I)yrinic acid a,c-diamide adenosyltransferase [Desulfobacteraceae bacterium]